MQRFPWSRDILGEASHADEVDHDLLMKLLMGGGKKKAAAKCKEGDLVECDPVSYTHLTLPTNREV